MVDKRKVYRMYEAGYTCDEIASEAGCSINSIMKEMHLDEEEVRKVVIHEKV